MCGRYLGFVLLVWVPGVLHAQSPTQPCSAPHLNGGYFVPEQEAYSHETKLTYACDNGSKPAVEGWWATSTCQNGTWSPEPQCIDENACIPPDIPNAKYTESQRGWYEDKYTIRITCDKGYESKGWDATAKCDSGIWTSVPVCEKSADSCGAPPQVLHAVVVHQEYQELFPVDAKVQYECEDGYTVEGADSKKYIYCIDGNWTEGPTCSKEAEPGAGSGGSAGGDTTSAGSGTQPAGGGSSTTSGSSGGDGKPLFTTIDQCGPLPVVPNGDVMQKDRLFVKYQCNAFYTQVGPETVVCYNSGHWSEQPTCKAAFCVLDPADSRMSNFRLSGVAYVKEGESKFIPCFWEYYFSLARCVNGRLTLTQCCQKYYHDVGRCP